MSELDDLEEIWDQVRPSVNSSRQTRAQRRARLEFRSRGVEAMRSVDKQGQRASERRMALAESANRK